MNLLLDTQAFLYMTECPDRLPSCARAAIEDPRNLRLLSVASPWKLQIKMMLGKLRLARSVRETVQFDLGRGALRLLPITLDHIDTLAGLPPHHRDPFDRLLIAQAIHDGLTIVTGDRLIPQYPVPCLWE